MEFSAKLRDVGAERRKWEREADEERVKHLRPVAGKFRTLLIDPAYEGGGSYIGMPYATQSHAEHMALPVEHWLEDAAHLYLCTSAGDQMRKSFELLDEWSRRCAAHGPPLIYRQCLTWEKIGISGQPRMGMGFYFRNATEHVLFATRGKLWTKPAALTISTVFRGRVGEHSAKPDALYDLIRRASYPPYGEAFQRTAREGFVNLFEQRQTRGRKVA